MDLTNVNFFQSAVRERMFRSSWPIHGLASVFLILLAFAILRHHSARIPGDAFTYVTYARNVAHGHMHMDGPVAEAIRALWSEQVAKLGPIWNIGILPDGRSIYTVAPGYPIVLALFLTLGGTWAMVHANIILLVLCLGLWYLLTGQRHEQDKPHWFRAFIAIGLLPWLMPSTFSQFTHIWREPLFYSLLILSGLSLVKFVQRGHAAWLGLAALAMGYACATKEANIIYLPWMGLFVLFSHHFLRYQGKLRLIAVCAILFAIGMAPLLIKNAWTTGNPLMGLQFVRETAQFNMGGKHVAGLSPSNVPQTFRMYRIFFDQHIWFAWPLLLLAGWGLARSFREPVARFLAGCGFMHILFYLQWGNADMRHMFFVNFPYSFFLAAGGLDLARQIRCRIPERVVTPLLGGGVVLTVLTLLWPVARPALSAPRADLFGFREAMALSRDIEQMTPTNGVLLVNRELRNILAAYSERPVVRVQELAGIVKDRDVTTVIDHLRATNFAFFFLDNIDMDPRNSGRVNWALADERILRDHYDLDPIGTLERSTYHLYNYLDKPELTIYRVTPWEETPVKRTLSWPEGGTAYLFLRPGRARLPLSYFVEEQPLEVPAYPAWFMPVPTGLSATNTAVLRVEGNDQPLPRFDDARLIGWDEPITIQYGFDALWSPDGFIVDYATPPALPPHNRYYAHGQSRATFRIPVRQGSHLFTYAILRAPSLGVRDVVDTRFTVADTESVIAPHEDAYVFFPLHIAMNTPTNQSMVAPVSLHTDPPHDIVLQWLRLDVHRTRLEPERRDNLSGYILSGRLAPAQPAVDPVAWHATLNGREIAQGHIGPNPLAPENRVRLAVPSRGGARRDTITLHNAGLAGAEWMPVKTTVATHPGTSSEVFMLHGHHQTEHDGNDFFVWTKDQCRFVVPISGNAASYVLTLDVRSGHPVATNRQALVRVGNQSFTITLPAERTSLTIPVLLSETAAAQHAPMTTIDIEVKSWSPDALGHSTDSRQLGFQFYGMTWAPAAD